MLNWKLKEYRDGDVATFRVCGITAVVQEMDGDGTYWAVKDGGRIAFEGNKYGHDDFNNALEVAERALREHVGFRKFLLSYHAEKGDRK